MTCCAKPVDIRVNFFMTIPDYPATYDAEHDEWTAYDDRNRIVAAAKSKAEAQQHVFAALLEREMARWPRSTRRMAAR